MPSFVNGLTKVVQSFTTCGHQSVPQSPTKTPHFLPASLSFDRSAISKHCRPHSMIMRWGGAMFNASSAAMWKRRLSKKNMSFSEQKPPWIVMDLPGTSSPSSEQYCDVSNRWKGMRTWASHPRTNMFQYFMAPQAPPGKRVISAFTFTRLFGGSTGPFARPRMRQRETGSPRTSVISSCGGDSNVQACTTRKGSSLDGVNVKLM
mmetsp:Transcript_17062/g.54646  ORF Transcript_17062/g.54646 Transcript_17062/m.54646 type:complete len:205 (-) Transcript_17062:359-973(-)